LEACRQPQSGFDLKIFEIEMDTFLELRDPRLTATVSGAALEKLGSMASWGEGPVWIENPACLLFSDIPNNRMLVWSEDQGLRVWASNVDFTNGHCLDLNGDLLHCSHGKRGIYRTPVAMGLLRSGTPMQCVVDRFEGLRLNSPNDLVVKRDGSIWFTDPPYGIVSDREGHRAPSEIGLNGVYRWDPSTQALERVTDWLDEPNGLAFSPDEKTLYVSDTSAALRAPGQGHHHIVAFDVVNGKEITNPHIFAVINPGLPDGLRTDKQGFIYTSSGDSVQVFHPDGTLLGKLYVPEKVGNLTFGGPHHNELFVVATTSLYRIRLNTQEAQAL
jgi:gluconolactonase